MAQGYADNQFESERMPYALSTLNTTNQVIGAAPQRYLGKKVQLTGGETVFVTANLDISVSASDGVAQTAVAALRVTYPGGTTARFSNQPIRLHVAPQVTVVSSGGGGPGPNGQSTVGVRATVGYSWPIKSRKQTGGTHIFDIVTSGGGTVNAGTIMLLVF